MSAIFRVELKDIEINGECNVCSRAQRQISMVSAMC